ncbi:MAG: GerMN domain-containing protein [Fusicatenibacter sp.]|nr:GerMN domain-containing protein [Fusicatenibacter sp.]
MRRFWCVLLAALMAMSCCTGCEKVQEESAYQLFYLDKTETTIVSEAYSPTNDSAEKLVKELIDAMQEAPAEPENRKLLTEGSEIESYTLEKGLLTLNVGAGYLQMERSREVLVRAGLVRAFVQIPEVERVLFLVEGEPLTDSAGREIGVLTADSFVENSGQEIYQYQYATLTLYFANAKGDKLVPETRRVPYSTNLPLERVVVEQLIKGPKEDGHFPVLPDTANVLSVTTSERITYVNFDNTVTDSILNVAEEIPIYAVVNSIAANCKVDKVQFSINGESDVTFREKIQLNQFFEEDFSYLEDDEN